MSRHLVIAVTGTPGVGKSSFARAIASRLDATVIDLNLLIRKKKIYKLDFDGARIANIHRMREEFSRIVKKFQRPIIVEGHLAHLLPPKLISHVVVLRAEPNVIERRLRKRRYSKSKIRDNAEAEALDIILCEAINVQGIEKIYEIDTTNLKTNSVVKLVLDALAGKVSLRPGKIDWLEKYFKPNN